MNYIATDGAFECSSIYGLQRPDDFTSMRKIKCLNVSSTVHRDGAWGRQVEGGCPGLRSRVLKLKEVPAAQTIFCNIWAGFNVYFDDFWLFRTNRETVYR